MDDAVLFLIGKLSIMALTREQKEQAISSMDQEIAAATSVVFVSFDALTIVDVNELRDKLFESGSRMRVMPKRLLRLVMQQRGLEFDPTTHTGQMAVIWGSDAVAPAKVLYEFAKSHENLQLLAGSLEGETISLEQVKSLAQLPSKQELLGQLVGVLAGPMRGFASVLSGVPRNMVYVLSAIQEQKDKG